MSTGFERSVPDDDTLRAEADVRASIDLSVSQADFTDAPVPDFSAATPDARQVLAELAGHRELDGETRERLTAALAELPARSDETP